MYKEVKTRRNYDEGGNFLENTCYGHVEKDVDQFFTQIYVY